MPPAHMNEKFKIKSDFEFYCYLKAHLPAGYKIISEPSKSYYSEWKYDYKIYHKKILYKEYSGDFRTIKAGSLINEAENIMYNLEIK